MRMNSGHKKEVRVKLPVELVARLKDVARHNHRSVTQEVHHYIESYLNAVNDGS